MEFHLQSKRESVMFKSKTIQTSHIKIKDIYKIVSQHNDVSEPQTKSKPDFVDLTKETESNNKKSGCSACN